MVWLSADTHDGFQVHVDTPSAKQHFGSMQSWSAAAEVFLRDLYSVVVVGSGTKEAFSGAA